MTDTPAAPTTPERIFADHRKCGSPNGYDGCYSHPVSGDAHCRQDGMEWPCDVELLRQTRSTLSEPLDVERLRPNDEWPAGISDGLSLSCSDCGEVPSFDYHVTEEFWQQWGDGPNVVCLPCLDLRCGGMGLAGAVEQITWTGTGHSIVTEPTRRIDYSAWRDIDATG